MDVKCEPGSIKIDIKMVRIALRQKEKRNVCVPSQMAFISL